MLSRKIQASIKITILGELNELAYENLIRFINTSSPFGKVAFGLEECEEYRFF